MLNISNTFPTLIYLKYFQVSQGGSCPPCPPKHHHSAVVHNQAMYVFGGMSDLQERSDRWKFDFGERQWHSHQHAKQKWEVVVKFGRLWHLISKRNSSLLTSQSLENYQSLASSDLKDISCFLFRDGQEDWGHSSPHSSSSIWTALANCKNLSVANSLQPGYPHNNRKTVTQNLLSPNVLHLSCS